MRIAVTIEHFSAPTGGAEAYAVTVLGELVRRGHEVVVYAVDGDDLEGVSCVRLPLDDAPGRIAAREFDITVDWGLNVPAQLHRLGGGTHREFQRLALQALPPFRRLPKQLFYALSARHRRTARAELRLLRVPGTHVLAVSHFVADQVRQTIDMEPERLHVLHNGVDTNRFDPAVLGPARTAVRKELGIGMEDTVFLMVAHNLALKNFALLKRLFDRLATTTPRIRLLLLGKRNPGIKAPWFVYAGASPCPERFYAVADVLLHPTYYDACANVLLEAMAAGLAVVSSDRNGSAELLESGDDGLVLPVVGNRRAVETAWYDAILKLAECPTYRASLGTAARNRADHQNMSRYVTRFEELLHTIRADAAGTPSLAAAVPSSSKRS